MQGEQNSSSTSFFLSVALCLVILVCVGWAAATVVFYRRAMEAEKSAALAIKQERLAEDKMQQAEQRAAAAEQALHRTSFQLAYVKNAIGVEWLSEAELAVVRPTLLNDPVMKKLEEQIAADRARVKEQFDPAGLIRDDYHTTLNTACDEIRAFKKQVAKLEEENSKLITERDTALNELNKLTE